MFKDRLIFVSAVISAILNIILWLALAGKFGWSSETVPLHFSVIYGIDYLGSAWHVYQIPLTGLVMLGLNVWLAMLVYEKEKLFSYFLSFGNIVLHLALAAAAAALIALNV